MKSSIFKTIVVASILAFSNNIYAQLGIAGGVNLSTLRNGNTILRWDNSPGVGFQIGAFYDIHLSDKFKFQPSLMLLNETYRRSMLVEQGSTDDMKEAFKSFGFFIPLVFSYKLPVKSNENFLIDLGLYNSFGLWGKVDRTKDLVTTKADLYTEDFGRFDFGLITGIGYDTQKINYSLRVKHGYMLNGSTRDRPMAFLFTIGSKLQ